MRNLANYVSVGGAKTESEREEYIKIADDALRHELARCNVDTIEGALSEGEVISHITGKIGNITFTRAWSYWVITGKIPLSLAVLLYEDRIGKTDIRVAGHCGCPHPNEWAEWISKTTGKIACHSGEKQSIHAIYKKKPELLARFESEHAYCDKPQEDPDFEGFIMTYHIDTELGLYVFANAIKANNSLLNFKEAQQALIVS